MIPAVADPVSRRKRDWRRTEAATFDARRRDTRGAVLDVGTPQTILKMTAKPVAKLLDKGKIGPEALQAAQEIEAVFEAVSGSLLIKPLSWEKQDRGHSAHDPGWLIDATARYNRFKDHWSAMGKRGHPLLSVVIAAVHDHWPCSTIETAFRLRHGMAEKLLIAGLQDYAVRAGWVRGRLAREWLDLAAGLFRLREPRLTAGEKYASKSGV